MKLICAGAGVPAADCRWCNGAMGVPITFLDKYSPEQFEILNSNDYRASSAVKAKPHGLIKDKESAIAGHPTYVRLLIRSRS